MRATFNVSLFIFSKHSKATKGIKERADGKATGALHAKFPDASIQFTFINMLFIPFIILNFYYQIGGNCETKEYRYAITFLNRGTTKYVCE